MEGRIPLRLPSWRPSREQTRTALWAVLIICTLVAQAHPYPAPFAWLMWVVPVSCACLLVVWRWKAVPPLRSRMAARFSTPKQFERAALAIYLPMMVVYGLVVAVVFFTGFNEIYARSALTVVMSLVFLMVTIAIPWPPSEDPAPTPPELPPHG